MTIQQRNSICKSVLKKLLLERARQNNSAGLCYHLAYVGCIRMSDLSRHFPEFIEPNSEPKEWFGYWWPQNDYASRILYMENLIAQTETRV